MVRLVVPQELNEIPGNRSFNDLLQGLTLLEPKEILSMSHHQNMIFNSTNEKSTVSKTIWLSCRMNSVLLSLDSPRLRISKGNTMWLSNKIKIWSVNSTSRTNKMSNYNDKLTNSSEETINSNSKSQTCRLSSTTKKGTAMTWDNDINRRIKKHRTKEGTKKQASRKATSDRLPISRWTLLPKRIISKESYRLSKSKSSHKLTTKRH